MKYLDVLEPSKAQARLGIVGVIVFQADYVANLDTVLIIPCYPISAKLDLGLLTPQLTISEQVSLAFVHLLSFAPRKALKGKVIATAMPIRDSLIRAIDLLVTGH